MTEFVTVDLFCGAGGLSLGFERAGFKSAFAADRYFDPAATYAKNFPHAKVINKKMENITNEEILTALSERGVSKIAVLLAGFPCQGFSMAGNRDPNDPRNVLFKQTLRVTELLHPDFVVLENVPGILSMQDGEVVRTILEEYKKIGYEMEVRVLNAAEYGAPQLRKRAFFIGNRLGIANPYPVPVRTKGNFVSMRDAIDDLKSVAYGDPRYPNHDGTHHTTRIVEKISKLKPGESMYDTYTESWRRAVGDLPAPTIKENHGAPHIHYELNRTISAREMARLQGFPDDFVFVGKMKDVMFQIGGAVPVPLAEHVARAIDSALNKYYSEHEGEE